MPQREVEDADAARVLSHSEQTVAPVGLDVGQDVVTVLAAGEEPSTEPVIREVLAVRSHPLEPFETALDPARSGARDQRRTEWPQSPQSMMELRVHRRPTE